MKEPYATVAGRIFRTQKELLMEARRLLNIAYQPGERISLPTDHEFMVAFLARHPNAALKVPRPIDRFEVRLHKIDDSYELSRGFYVVLDDGSASTFSLYPCVDQKRSTQADKITLACRMAIIKTTNQFKITAFRDTETVACAISGEMIRWKDAVVDHGPPYPLKRIVDEYMMLLGEAFWRVPIRARKNFAGAWEFSTPEAAAHFIRFHDRRAVLRIAKRRANTSAGSHGYKSTFVEPPKPGHAP